MIRIGKGMRFANMSTFMLCLVLSSFKTRTNVLIDFQILKVF